MLEIGENHPCFIVAEIGINHHGDIDTAKTLIDAAKSAEADAVKFQTYKSKLLAKYRDDKTMTYLKRAELSYRDHLKLREYCGAKGIIFMSTPFDVGSARMLCEIGMTVFKVGSGNLLDEELIDYVAGTPCDLIISTGMATLEEVGSAVLAIRHEDKAKEPILLHCVSAYPAKLEDVNLRALETLRKAFELPVGLSDHTTSTVIPAAAVALGACVIEKHLTLSRMQVGPDHKASLEPHEFALMVDHIRDVEKALGDGVKGPQECETGRGQRIQ